MKEPSIRPTRYKEIGYRQDCRGVWRFVDQSTGQSIGLHYHSRAELLADLGHFAAAFGAEGDPKYIHGVIHIPAETGKEVSR